jgi:hypothetical protein
VSSRVRLVANSGPIGRDRPLRRKPWSGNVHLRPWWPRWLLYFAAFLQLAEWAAVGVGTATITSQAMPARHPPAPGVLQTIRHHRRTTLPTPWSCTRRDVTALPPDDVLIAAGSMARSRSPPGGLGWLRRMHEARSTQLN